MIIVMITNSHLHTKMIHKSKEVDYKLFGCWRGQRPFYVENNATGEMSKDILLLLTILTLAFVNYNTNTLLQIHNYTNTQIQIHKFKNEFLMNALRSVWHILCIFLSLYSHITHFKCELSSFPQHKQSVWIVSSKKRANHGWEKLR